MSTCRRLLRIAVCVAAAIVIQLSSVMTMTVPCRTGSGNVCIDTGCELAGGTCGRVDDYPGCSCVCPPGTAYHPSTGCEGPHLALD